MSVKEGSRGGGVVEVSAASAASTLYRNIVFPIFEMNCKDFGMEFKYSLLMESAGSAVAVGIKRCIFGKDCRS